MCDSRFVQCRVIDYFKRNEMSELSYKELQEQGIFDVPYRAFEFMQSQQAKIDAITKQRDSFIKAHHIAMNDVCEHKAKIDELQSRVDAIEKWLNKEKFVPTETWITDDIIWAEELLGILKGNKDESIREL